MTARIYGVWKQDIDPRWLLCILALARLLPLMLLSCLTSDHWLLKAIFVLQLIARSNVNKRSASVLLTSCLKFLAIFVSVSLHLARAHFAQERIELQQWSACNG